MPVSKSFLSSIKLFFVHVLLSSQSQLLQYTSQSHLILHLMHLQLMPHILVILSLSTLYFSIFPTSFSFTRTSPDMVTSTILTSFLVLSIITISGRRASILVSHWIVKSHRIFYPLFSITPSGSCSYHCCAPRKPCFSHSLQLICLHTLPCLFIYSF